MYHVLLYKSEMESDFDIFGCTSECETIRLAISLVCLICNISLLRETRRRVAIRAVSIPRLLWESRSRSRPGFERICCKVDLSLVLETGVPFQAYSLRGLHVLARVFV